MTFIRTLIFSLIMLIFSQSLMALESVSSPDGTVVFSVASNDKNWLVYTVTFHGEVAIAESRLGLRFREQKGLDANLVIQKTDRHTVDDTWEQPWGERRRVRDHHNEMFIQLMDDTERRLDLRVRVFNDGVGFRYEVPAQAGLDKVEIVEELTEFHLPKEATAWWIPGRAYNRYEYLYKQTGLDAIQLAHTPMTLRTPTGMHLSLHEAALVDYAGYVLDHRRENVFQTNLTPWSDGTRVKTRTPFKTPWRTVQISKDAVGLLNSNLILNLNEPNRLGDVSWVKPGKYVGIWWAMHIRERTWGTGPIHGATTAETERYMDFAAKYGFDSVLVEAWNVGWDGDWFFNGDLFSFARRIIALRKAHPLLRAGEFFGTSGSPADIIWLKRP